MDHPYDRTKEDLGNIVGLEHVNVTVPDQQLATLYYVSGLGMTRDPYLMTSTDNMWINVGRSQFHLPTGKPQVMRGRVGLVVPDLGELLQRLGRVREQLAGTKFDYREGNGYVDTVCPWGNRIRMHGPDPRFGYVTLGMPYVEFEVPTGTADGIVRFYREILGATATTEKDGKTSLARVAVGDCQDLVFRETGEKLADYDGHHLQVYIADFSGPHKRLIDKGLLTEESDAHQYRFLDIVDPKSGQALFRLEHEVRSMRHPLYARPLVNRNPAQSNRNYVPGKDGWAWSVAQPVDEIAMRRMRPRQAAQ